MIIKELIRGGHVRRFTMNEAAGEGWEFQEEEDSRVIRSVRYRDWHRVERALASLTDEVNELEARGWRRLQNC